MRMCADIVQCIHPFAGVANQDLAACHDGGAHAALGNIGERHDRLENGFGHLGRMAFRMRETAL
jgi:hypothetical protein